MNQIFSFFLFRNFNLRLKRDTTIFSPDLVIEVSGEESPGDTSHIYSGEIFGKSLVGLFYHVATSVCVKSHTHLCIQSCHILVLFVLIAVKTMQAFLYLNCIISIYYIIYFKLYPP